MPRKAGPPQKLAVRIQIPRPRHFPKQCGNPYCTVSISGAGFVNFGEGPVSPGGMFTDRCNACSTHYNQLGENDSLSRGVREGEGKKLLAEAELLPVNDLWCGSFDCRVHIQSTGFIVFGQAKPVTAHYWTKPCETCQKALGTMVNTESQMKTRRGTKVWNWMSLTSDVVSELEKPKGKPNMVEVDFAGMELKMLNDARKSSGKSELTMEEARATVAAQDPAPDMPVFRRPAGESMAGIGCQDPDCLRSVNELGVVHFGTGPVLNVDGMFADGCDVCTRLPGGDLNTPNQYKRRAELLEKKYRGWDLMNQSAFTGGCQTPQCRANIRANGMMSFGTGELSGIRFENLCTKCWDDFRQIVNSPEQKKLTLQRVGAHSAIATYGTVMVQALGLETEWVKAQGSLDVGKAQGAVDDAAREAGKLIVDVEGWPSSHLGHERRAWDAPWLPVPLSELTEDTQKQIEEFPFRFYRVFQVRGERWPLMHIGLEIGFDPEGKAERMLPTIRMKWRAGSWQNPTYSWPVSLSPYVAEMMMKALEESRQ